MVSILIARGMVVEQCAQRGHSVLRRRGDRDCPVCRAEAEARYAAQLAWELFLPDLTEHAMEMSQ